MYALTLGLALATLDTEMLELWHARQAFPPPDVLRRLEVETHPLRLRIFALSNAFRGPHSLPLRAVVGPLPVEVFCAAYSFEWAENECGRLFHLELGWRAGVILQISRAQPSGEARLADWDYLVRRPASWTVPPTRR
jgi:hypothetical protein